MRNAHFVFAGLFNSGVQRQGNREVGALRMVELPPATETAFAIERCVRMRIRGNAAVFGHSLDLKPGSSESAPVIATCFYCYWIYACVFYAEIQHGVLAKKILFLIKT